jgi:hypothetical protein
MDWSCGSRGRVPTLQAQRPEFKPHPPPKKKKSGIRCSMGKGGNRLEGCRIIQGVREGLAEMTWSKDVK